MPIEWNCEKTDLIVYYVRGELGLAELEKVQQESDQLIVRASNWKVLVLLEDFAGWAKESGWGNTALIEETDQNVDRMAIVGPPQWRDQVEMFTLKGLRPVDIEYFSTETDARAWLGV